MRLYMDIVRQYIEEAVFAELERVADPGNQSREIGSAGASVQNDMSDMLPHNSVWDRNKPQAYAEIFARNAKGHNDSFEREQAPPHRSIERRRNNDAGFKKLDSVPPKGDAGALLHADYAGGPKATKSSVPTFTRKFLR